jgi:radical SAM superfamily enzyme
MGEAEETGSRIFPALLDGYSVSDTEAGITFRRDGKIICNGLPPLVGSNCKVAQSTLDSTPSPYLSGILSDGKAGVLSGRGCTHHCQYCVFASLGRKKLRVHSVERVVAELEFIADRQKRTGEHYVVDIQDDAFTLLPERAKELCQGIADRKLGLFLTCITRADMIDEELMRLMREAGFVSLAFGLESAVPSVLRAIGKVRPPDWPDPGLEPEQQFIEQVRTSIIVAKKYGFTVGMSIILGLPTETARDGAATLRFVKEMPVDFYMHNFLLVYPGTPLWETHDRYGIKCKVNLAGLPITYEYPYDITKLRPRPKCSLEQDAHTIKLLTTDALYGCETGSAHEGNTEVIIVNAPRTSGNLASWMAQILSVGGIVVHTYPRLKREEEYSKLEADRCMFDEYMVPARHYIQLIPKKPDEEADERWRIVCSGIDLYGKHKPSLVTLMFSNGPEPLINWLHGKPGITSLCELSGYLEQPDELVDFLDDLGQQDISQYLRRMAIPPDLKYSGRWLHGKTPCLKLTRIEVDRHGLVYCCRHGLPIGKIGNTLERLRERLQDFIRKAEQRRGCNNCPNLSCPRCPFPGVDDQTYCGIFHNHKRIINLLQQIRIYARLPYILVKQDEI